MNIWPVIFLLREFFFPRGCARCGTPLAGRDEVWYGLCGPCREQFAPHSGGRCDSCGRPLISEQGRCLSCRNGDPRNFDRSILLFPYMGKNRHILGAYKFGKNQGLGHFFADQIRAALSVPERVPPDGAALVPVPPRPGKLRQSGWDQVEFLAQTLEKGEGGPPVDRCLKRLPSRNQKELNRENRQTNLKGKIILTKTPPRHAIVLDDVCTTGSTLDACAAALKAGGTESVLGLCLFYG